MITDEDVEGRAVVLRVKFSPFPRFQQVSRDAQIQIPEILYISEKENPYTFLHIINIILQNQQYKHKEYILINFFFTYLFLKLTI